MLKEDKARMAAVEKKMWPNSQSVKWYGRAATAIYDALRYILQDWESRQIGLVPEIILPGLSCSTPSNVALFAGFRLRYADIDIDTGLMDVSQVSKLTNEATACVFFIHLYGNVSDLTQLSQWCKERKIYLVEDLAQALGAKSIGAKTLKSPGEFGDFSVYSFNHTKIVENGGGALVVNRENTYMAKADQMPFWGEVEINKALLSQNYRNLHHSLVYAMRENLVQPHEVSKLFLKIRAKFMPLFFQPFSYSDLLMESLERLDENLGNRSEKSNMYHQVIETYDVLKPITDIRGNVCWRYTFLLNDEDNVIDFSEKVRKDGFHVSNLYWPVNQFFNPSDFCPNANSFARRVVNLWVDTKVSVNDVDKCLESIQKNLKLKAR